MTKNEYSNNMTLYEILGLKDLLMSDFSKNMIMSINKSDIKKVKKRKLNKKRLICFITIILFIMLFISGLLYIFLNI